MVTKTLEDLFAAINEKPSEYEEKYVRFASINFDKQALVELLYELKYLKENDEWPERQEFLQGILNKHDPEHLYNLLTNEPTTVRFAAIEKWARRAAMEVLIFDKYSIETLNTITQFPLSDYQLVVKRVQEIVATIRDITTQSAKLAAGVAGL